MSAKSAQVTSLLKAWRAGDDDALDRLMPLMYDELHRNARRHMRRERPGNTLQTTALVNQAYLRLVDVGGVDWKDRAHFIAVSSTIMRRILVDAARARGSAKRGGQLQKVAHQSTINLDDIADMSPSRADGLVALDGALALFAKLDPRKARVVELRFFGGLSVEEIGEVLAVSPQTVMRDWKLAKAWLKRELDKGA